MERRLSGGSTHTTTTTEEEHDSLASSSRSSPTSEKRMMLRRLQEFWESSGIPLSKETVYRFAVFHDFDFERTKEALEENRENDHLSLQMRGSLKRQFATKTIFPLCGLRTKDKMEVCYLQASQFVLPDNASSANYSTLFVENLCYVLNDLSRTREQCKRGVAVVINMKHYEESNYSFDLWMQLMMTLQGNLVPTTVNLVLLVDSPQWFQTQVWKAQTKPILTECFYKRCHLIEGEELVKGDYFADGCEAFMPTEAGGWKEAEEIVVDYQDLKTFQERQRLEGIAMVPEDM
ncbi:MAG: hypothetical protein SGBAC_009886 [Bacillariaceae sp.]